MLRPRFSLRQIPDNRFSYVLKNVVFACNLCAREKNKKINATISTRISSPFSLYEKRESRSCYNNISKYLRTKNRKPMEIAKKICRASFQLK